MKSIKNNLEDLIVQAVLEENPQLNYHFKSKHKSCIESYLLENNVAYSIGAGYNGDEILTISIKQFD